MRFFITPSSFAHLRIECSQFALATDAIIIIKIRIAKIKPDFFSLSIQFLIGSIFQKVSEIVLIAEDCQNRYGGCQHTYAYTQKLFGVYFHRSSLFSLYKIVL